MAEFDLIDIIRHRAGDGDAHTPLSIGDDAAVLSPTPGEHLVVSTDTLNEGVHFFPGTDPYRLGHKALAVSLSDMAAMGARPCWAFLALSIPRADENWLHSFIDGFMTLADREKVTLAGGDTCSGPLSLAVTVIGQVVESKAIKRSGAAEGDLVAVTGRLGEAAFALSRIRAGEQVGEEARARLERPEPRSGFGQAVASLASACIDVSDGLVADLGHIACASNLAAVVNVSSLPSSPVLDQLPVGEKTRFQLTGGDDYELCFTFSPDRLPAIRALSETWELPVSVIGLMQAGSGVRCVDAQGDEMIPPGKSHEHFRAVNDD